MQERWQRFWNTVTKTAGEEQWRALCDAYGEKHRAYHNLRHIQDCFAQWAAAPEPVERPQEMEAAIWFHDVVYKPSSTRNEEASAEWACAALEAAGVADEFIGRVEALILATRHDAVPESPDARLLVDVDLSILGRDRESFQRYEDQIRREYRWVPGPLYHRKRAALLRTFLERPRIYSTPSFHDRFEEVARRNLKASISTLEGRSGGDGGGP